jgi:two-component system, cell cycle response regulator
VAAGRKDRILIIDDSRSLRQEIREVLEKAGIDGDFYEAGNGLEGFKILLDHPVDLVFCDLVMPQIDGAKFLQMRAGRTYLLDVPVLMLTAIGDIEQKVKVLSQGANDYITKPFHPGELVARAQVHLKIKHLQDELRHKNALLVELSTTDSLTKIYNRRHFLELARKEFERSSRMGLQLAMLILDVDHFKTINDTFGHQAGDEVLLSVCKVVDSTLRDYDIFGRYGGDEFTIVFPQTELSQAMRVAERLEANVQELAMECVKKTKLTLSGGLAAKSSSHKDLESLIKDADEALYRAKQTGRAKIVGF